VSDTGIDLTPNKSYFGKWLFFFIQNLCEEHTLWSLSPGYKKPSYTTEWNCSPICHYCMDSDNFTFCIYCHI